jgi:hypothetical protein
MESVHQQRPDRIGNRIHAAVQIRDGAGKSVSRLGHLKFPQWAPFRTARPYANLVGERTSETARFASFSTAPAGFPADGQAPEIECKAWLASARRGWTFPAPAMSITCVR